MHSSDNGEHDDRARSDTDERYHTLLNALDEGFCIIEVLFDVDGKPYDYRFLETNHAFENQTGIKDAEGKCMREIAPSHEAHWFETYGKVALTGEPVRFENRSQATESLLQRLCVSDQVLDIKSRHPIQRYFRT